MRYHLWKNRGGALARRKTSAAGWVAILLLGGVIAASDFIVRNPGILILPAIVVAIWATIRLFGGNTKPQPAEVPATVARRVRPRQDTYRVSVSASQRARPYTPQSRKGDDFWIPHSKDAEIAGRKLGSLIYVGRGLAAVNGDDIEPALVDPKLSVSKRIRDCTERRLDYWSSYSYASSEARAAYLHWLATGRSDPAADIGYVFLYFYGLERRALHDGRTSSAAKGEILDIEQEVVRLLRIYGDNRSFLRYAQSFVDFLQARRCPEASYTRPPTPHTGQDLRFSDRLALAQCAADGKPLPAEWAHVWVTSNQSSALSMPARRCPAEFGQLFKSRYKEQFGEGIKLLKNRTRLKFDYRPASASFDGNEEDLSITVDVPDVSVLTAPLRKLEKIAEQVCDELSRYSRVIGKVPESAHSFEGLAELPFSLWPEQHRTPIESIQEVIRRAGKPAAIPFEKFQSLIPGLTELTRAKYRSLSVSLGTARLGLEPDVRFGGRVPEPGSKVVLFSDDPDTAGDEATAAYTAAALTLHLATAVIAADGETTDSEKGLLLEQFEHWLHLSESESRRLHAHLRLLLSQPPKLTGLKKKIEGLRVEARETLGDFLVRLAQADGNVAPEEIKTLQKVFKLLGLDPGFVFSKVHAAATEPVTLAPASQPERGRYAIPRPPERKKPTPGLQLDAEKIARLQKDSERVARILAEVFAESTPAEETETEPESESDDVQAEQLLGLDPTHSALLRILISRKQWDREELEELASDRDLMLDGALEHINEASFDLLEIPMIEHGNPLMVNEEAAREIYGDHHPKS